MVLRKVRKIMQNHAKSGKIIENHGKSGIIMESQGKSGNCLCDLENSMFSRQNQGIFSLI